MKVEEIPAETHGRERPPASAVTGRRGTVEPPPKGRRPGMLAPLAYRDYRLLLSGSLATQTGYWMQQVAQGWLMLLLTNSPFYVGLLGFARGLPMLLLSLPAGALVDRLDRQRLLVAMQAAAALVAVGLAVLIAAGLIRPWHLVLGAVLSGSLASVVFPTRQTLVPAVVPGARLRQAVALNAAGQNATRVVGPSVAGVLIALVGVAGCYFLQAAGFVYALTASARLRLTQAERTGAEGGIWSSLVEGLRYVIRTPALRGLLGLAAIPALLAMPYLQLMPVFARDVLRVGSTGLGMLMAAVGVGAVIGALAIASRGEIRSRGLLLLASALGLGSTLVLFSLSRSFWLSLGLLPFVGACTSAYMAMNTTLLHTNSDDEHRGRVMSVYMITWGLMPLGVLPQGALAGRIGAPLTVGIAGLACALFVIVVGLRSPTLRGLR